MGLHDHFNDTISRLSAEDYVRKLVEIGWFSGIPHEEVEQLNSSIEERFSEDDPRWRHYAFYDLAVAVFDGELVGTAGPGKGSYYWVINLLAERSNGVFTPDTIVDELDDERHIARVAFRHDGRTYEREVRWESDWFDFQILDLVNEALESSGTDARFIPLPASDQNVHLALVSEGVYRRAVELGLIPAGETYKYDA